MGMGKGKGMGDNELGKRAQVQSVLGPDDRTSTVLHCL